MMAASFKPVGWVAAIGGAALLCYMMSLNVASERAELLKLERNIVAAKQDIRRLQTELGTRGRLSQLEHWNAEVLALSAPSAAQFLDDEVTLARFDTRVVPDRGAKVQLASAELAPPPGAVLAAPAAPHAAPARAPEVRLASAEAAPYPLLRQAGMMVGPVAPAPAARPIALIDSALAAKIAAPAKPDSSVKQGGEKRALAKGGEAKTEPGAKAAAVKAEPVKKTKLAAADPVRSDKKVAAR